jgi:ribosomal-protein-alanine N-acetyltransferase
MTAKLEGQISIRAMNPQDLEVVGEIDRLSFALPWPAKAFQFELFENFNSWLSVAEMETSPGEATVIGVIVMWFIIDEVHISTLAVHPDYRRRGVAEGLLTDALKESQRRRALAATLEVRASNIPAQGLYKKFGFEIVGRRIRYYRDNDEDALVMTLKPISYRPINQPDDHSEKNNRNHQ